MAILDDTRLKELHALATQSGLAALVEVHDEEELERALSVDPVIIGVNNRNLKTFDVDLANTERLAARLRYLAPTSKATLVAESGIHTRRDVERLRGCGAQAILVGESLIRDGDLAARVRVLLGTT